MAASRFLRPKNWGRPVTRPAQTEKYRAHFNARQQPKGCRRIEPRDLPGLANTSGFLPLFSRCGSGALPRNAGARIVQAAIACAKPLAVNWACTGAATVANDPVFVIPDCCAGVSLATAEGAETGSLASRRSESISSLSCGSGAWRPKPSPADPLSCRQARLRRAGMQSSSQSGMHSDSRIWMRRPLQSVRGSPVATDIIPSGASPVSYEPERQKAARRPPFAKSSWILRKSLDPRFRGDDEPAKPGAHCAPGPVRHLMILETTPAPTVRPPSRIAKRRPSSIATGLIRSTTIFTLSPGITISTPSGSVTAPVMSVVRK